MKRFGKITWWLIWNVGVLLLCYDGVIRGQHWQWNVFRFLTWTSFIGSLVFSFGGTERHERTVPDMFNTGADLVLTLMCVAWGHFLLGTLWFLSPAFTQLGYRKNHEKFPAGDQE